MYQSYETSSHDHGAERLAALRSELDRQGLDGFIIPRADAHQGENVPARDERLRWLTGFTGSAGLCIVLRDKAGMFIDGRYTLQAQDQLDLSAFTPVQIEDQKPEDWLAAHAGDAIIGFDPWLLTESQKARFEAKATLRAVAENPLDATWTNQPSPPMGSVTAHPAALAGVSSEEKRAEAAEELSSDTLDAFVLTLPDSINWLLNIRGGDVAHTPVGLGFAILHATGAVDLFMEDDKIEGPIRTHLGSDVTLKSPDAFASALKGFSGRRVGVEKATAPVAVSDLLLAGGAERVWAKDPCTMPKACKNSVEREGARKAHLRDGAAITRFLCWFDGAVGAGDLTEISVAEKLEAFREDTGKLEDISFDTISAFGEHGALPHYRVSRESDLTIKGNSLYLVDSGGQYRDGTTDITRTIAVGEPSDDHRKAFTLVLRGMIEVTLARFPEGTTGVQLDVMARMALWRAGLDFDHGTGHGVGSYLGVHEGPCGISKRSTVPLKPGMLLSNEPGYYREGAFGIRIENLVFVEPPSVPEGGDRAMLGFETITLAPIDLRLIDPALLGAEHIAWLNAYHARVYEALFPLLDDTTREWLEDATAEIKPG
jgi:Xaa-Pro aminopeptidase